LLWKAFARRGLGYKADQGSSSSLFDGTESFEVPPPIKNESLDEMTNSNQLKLFPNPSNGFVEIENISKFKIDKIIILDLMGKEIYVKNISNASFNVKLDLSSLQNGMYMVNIVLENQQKFIQKFVKE
jgi:uncharacterized radical SAM superfamily protein